MINKKYFAIFNSVVTKLVCIIVVLLFALLLMTYINRINEYPEGFYKFNIDELDGILVENEIVNFEIWPYSVERNSSGTSLRLGDISAKYKVIMSCDGSIKKVDIPSTASWLNDSNEVVAWKETGNVYYKNGYSEKGNFVVDNGTDPSGAFFWKKMGDNKAGLFSIEKPFDPLVILDAFRLRIFKKNDEIYIFGQKNKNTIDAYLFKLEADGIMKIDEYTISREKEASSPFWIVDYNVNTQDVVLIDVYDLPMKSKWYIYNNREKRLKKIGNAFDSGFFLMCDILKVFSSK